MVRSRVSRRTVASFLSALFGGDIAAFSKPNHKWDTVPAPHKTK